MLAELEQEHTELEQEFAERLVMMRYFDLSESEPWNMDKLLAAADRKTCRVRTGKTYAGKKKRRTRCEKSMCASRRKSARTAKRAAFAVADSTSTSFTGMDWLRKMVTPRRKMEEIVRRQPFPPYALVLSKQDLNACCTRQEVYTSPFQCPSYCASNRACMASQGGGLLALPDVHFLMWFNEKLLDEDALAPAGSGEGSELQDKRNRPRRAKSMRSILKRERLKNQKAHAEGNIRQKHAQMSEMKRCYEALTKALQAH